MMLQGRPLRFLALIVAGWVGWRAFILWPVIESAPLLEIPKAIIDAHWIGEAKAANVGVPISKSRAEPALSPVVPLPFAAEAPKRREDRLRFIYAGLSHFSGRFVADDVALGRSGIQPPEQIAGVAPQWPVDKADRWQASAWLMTRGGNIVGARQLGGSQAGLVVRHAVTDRIGSYARATTPLEGRGAELALGMDLGVAEAPVRLTAEHRFGLDGLPGGPALGAIAGIGPQPAGDIDVEAYGQAGVIWRDRTEPYGDGFVRVTHRVSETPLGNLDLGIGAWAAAQRDAQRVDVGPSIGVRVPIGARAVRLSVDWRERVAGDVDPGSGLALTIGADF